MAMLGQEMMKNDWRYEIDAEKCKGCTLCYRNCPIKAIISERLVPHVIIQEQCDRCGICISICKFKAINRVQGRYPVE